MCLPSSTYTQFFQDLPNHFNMQQQSVSLSAKVQTIDLKLLCSNVVNNLKRC